MARQHFSGKHPVCSLVLRSCSLLLILILCSTQLAEGTQPEEEKVQDFLKATVALRIRWDIDEAKIRNTGFMNIRATGLLQLNREMSSMAEGLPAVMVNYRNQNMMAHYSYQESITDKEPPGDCPNSVIETYEDSGQVMCQTAPGPGNLIINHFASLFQDTGLGFMTPPEVKDKLIDHYLLATIPNNVEVKGKKLDQSRCRWKESTRKLSAPINITGKIEKNGKMGGSETWTSQADSVSLPPQTGVKLNELPESINTKPFSPEKEDSGNVTYELSWQIEKVQPHVLIYRLKDNEWQDITDATAADKDQEILPGEKMTLRAIAVIPGETGASIGGNWDISSSDKILEDWQASETGTRKIESETDKNEIEFFWWQGVKNPKVTYTIEGKNLSGKSEFKMIMPQIRIESRPASSFLLYHPVDDEEAGNCVVSAGTENSQSIKISSVVSVAGNKPFCLQYVQLAESNVWKLVTEGQDFSWYNNIHDFMLDGSYPYNGVNCLAEAGPVPFDMIDTPTGPLQKTVASLYMAEQFRTYLMFRPGNSSDNNGWVPLKRVNWGLKVNATSKDNPYAYRRAGSWPPCEQRFELFGKKPPSRYDTSPRDAKDYPDWNGLSPTSFEDPTRGLQNETEKSKYIVEDSGDNYKSPPPE